jgi:serine/threonine-protein kinase
MACLSDEEVLAFLEGALGGPAAAAALEHLDGCADCRALVAESSQYESRDGVPTRTPTQREPGTPTPPRRRSIPDLAAGTEVGRYLVEGPLGAGAGGAVHRARDPQLKRAVALKIVPVLRASPEDDQATAQARVLREAEAMARLQHPNVVAVFDAGVYQDRVFIVMELVEGETLAEWLKRGGHDWRAILAAFVEAGRGLHAAHAAGLVHRDFKPGNVLVGADARVRVTDFGLARPPGMVRGPGAPPVPPPPAGSGSVSSDGVLTAVAGTPYFMAPEQFAEGVATPRSDQYSFAVALFAALYGYHPVEDGRGVDAAVALRPDIPADLHRALVPALAEDPERRYPTVADLLSALEAARARADAPARTRRAPLGLALAVAALGTLALIALRAPRGRDAAMATGVCGNGVVEPGEQCDDGNRSNDDACLSTCRFARCGDGFVRTGVEQCDGGDACSGRCLTCRDGDASFVWPETGSCYSRHDRPLPWADAGAACGAAGGHLVTFSSIHETRAVRESLFAEARAPHWIGLQRGAGRAFEWLTRETLVPVTSWWNPGEPRADGPSCVAASPVERLLEPAGLHPGSTWRAAACTQPLPFLCEREGWTVRPRDNHAYRFFYALSSWDDARAACAAAGGHLGTIADAEELSFVAALPGPTVWIGATDREQEGRFAWITGDPFTLSAFAPGEPDDPDGTSDCLVLGRDHVLHDRHCNDPNAFLCEIE